MKKTVEFIGISKNTKTTMVWHLSNTNENIQCMYKLLKRTKKANISRVKIYGTKK